MGFTALILGKNEETPTEKTWEAALPEKERKMRKPEGRIPRTLDGLCQLMAKQDENRHMDTTFSNELVLVIWQEKYFAE